VADGNGREGSTKSPSAVHHVAISPIRALLLRELCATSCNTILATSGLLHGGTFRLQIGFPMANDHSNDSKSTSNQDGSQDALRHQRDATHHKVHKGRPDEKNEEQSHESSTAMLAKQKIAEPQPKSLKAAD
jgi:hypothetical protein